MTPGLHGRTSRREWYCNGDDTRLLKRASDLCGAHVMTAPGREVCAWAAAITLRKAASQARRPPPQGQHPST